MKTTQTSWLRRQLRITWHLPAVLGILFVILSVAYKWNWLASSPPRVIHLAGTHSEIGLAHGQALADEIANLFQHYIVGGLVEREGWALEDLVAIGRHYERFIPTPYLEEMQSMRASAVSDGGLVTIFDGFGRAARPAVG